MSVLLATAVVAGCGSARAESAPEVPRVGKVGASASSYVGAGRKVVVLGDSLTVLGWKRLYRALARDHRLAITAWVGEGYNPGVLSRLAESEALVPLAARTTYAPTRPDVVVIALGTNDALYRRSTDRALAVMRQLVEMFGGACLVGVTLPEHLTIAKWSNEQARALNAGMREWADRVVDWARISIRPGALQPDSIHPTETGTRLRSAAIVSAVRTCRG
jgi:lysophospholipase L1-like esterase